MKDIFQSINGVILQDGSLQVGDMIISTHELESAQDIYEYCRNNNRLDIASSLINNPLLTIELLREVRAEQVQNPELKLSVATENGLPHALLTTINSMMENPHTRLTYCTKIDISSNG